MCPTSEVNNIFRTNSFGYETFWRSEKKSQKEHKTFFKHRNVTATGRIEFAIYAHEHIKISGRSIYRQSFGPSLNIVDFIIEQIAYTIQHVHINIVRVFIIIETSPLGFYTTKTVFAERQTRKHIYGSETGSRRSVILPKCIHNTILWVEKKWSEKKPNQKIFHFFQPKDLYTGIQFAGYNSQHPRTYAPMWNNNNTHILLQWFSIKRWYFLYIFFFFLDHLPGL